MNNSRHRSMYPVVLVMLLAVCCSSLVAQVPQRFSYQGIAREASGQPIANGRVSLKLSIVSGSPLGNIEYAETHQAVTNGLGLFNVQVGGGTPFLGTFADIVWKNGNKWLKVEMDPTGGNEYVALGTSQLLSVPYAIVAGSAGDIRMSDLKDVSVSGITNGQVLKWNGSQWLPGDGGGTTSVSERLTGNGTAGSPLDLARQNATSGQVLKWNGSAWVPGTDNGQTYQAGPGLEFTSGNTLSHAEHTGDVTGRTDLRVVALQGNRLANLLPANGEVLKWDALSSSWRPSTDNALNFIAGNGISIINSTISNSVWTVSGDKIARATGNVGIGTSNPTQTLDVKGNFRLSGAFMPNGQSGVPGQVLISDGADNDPIWETPKTLLAGTTWLLEGNSGTTPGTDFIGTNDAKDLVFKTGGTERLRIDASGNVGIGTSSPTTLVDLVGTKGYDQLRLRTNYTPSGSNDPNGTTGTITWDSSYIYVKTATGWKRATLSTW